MTAPQLPMEIDGDPAAVTSRIGAPRVEVDAAFARRLEDAGVEVIDEPAALVDAGRDWWPLAIGWGLRGQVPALPAVVVRPTDTEGVAATLRLATEARIPVTPVAGRSGVVGGAVPVHGGIALDLCGLTEGLTVDEISLTADVPAGIFGPDLEAALAAVGPGYTAGHYPQSIDLSTVGGWIACRGAGQASNRYGKIEDIVVGLTVVLPDGTFIETDGRAPRSATGPSLTQLFCGSEGTLGVITSARLRIHPLPGATGIRSFGFPDFGAGLEVCRRILRRGATPAVLRLYDLPESSRHFSTVDTAVLIVRDQADPLLVDATLAIVDEEARLAGAAVLDDAFISHWLEKRNDVSQLVPLWRAGIVVDTIEVAASWSVLPQLATDVCAQLSALPGTLLASVHQSHAYSDGACLYFTFAGRPDEGHPDDDLAWAQAFYDSAWETATSVVSGLGGAISHHHGIGLNRSRFLADALGPAFSVLVDVKAALDPLGIMNPGKLGLPDPFGPVPWP